MNGKTIKEIAFSIKESKLKKIYYDAFDKLPKKEAANMCGMFGGVRIIEDESLPENVMIWRFNNPIYNRIFIYKEGFIYEMPTFKNSFKLQDVLCQQ